MMLLFYEDSALNLKKKMHSAKDMGLLPYHMRLVPRTETLYVRTFLESSYGTRGEN